MWKQSIHNRVQLEFRLGGSSTSDNSYAVHDLSVPRRALGKTEYKDNRTSPSLDIETNGRNRTYRSMNISAPIRLRYAEGRVAAARR